MALALVGCGQADGEGTRDVIDDAGKADNLGDAEFETRNQQAQLMRGFNPLVDRADSTCVEVGGERPRIVVGADREAYRMQVVDDRQTLARALGIDLGLKVKYFGKSGSAELSLLDELELSGESLTLLVTADYSYAVSLAQEVDLSDRASDLLHNKGGADDWHPGWFSSKCGLGYTTGIRYGSSFSILITLDTQNEKHARSVAGKLGFDGGIGVVDVSAEVGSKFAQTITEENLSASIDYLGDGFRVPTGDSEAAFARGVAAESFTAETVEKFMSAMDAVRENARRSKEFDRCLDVGENDCLFVPVVPTDDGTFTEDSKRTEREAPGYLDNGDRAASVRAVGISGYRSLFGTSPSAYEALDWIDDADRRAREFLADYAKLDERMTAVYQRELATFAGDKSAFNVADPGTPVRDIGLLQGIHDRWVDRFAPNSATGVGTLMRKVEERQTECFESVQRSTYEDCLATVSRCEPTDGGCGFAPVEGEDTCTWCAVEDALLAYAETERLLPVRYQISGAVEYDQREAACSAFDTDYTTYRPATADEARRLAVAIAHGPITWDDDGEAHEVWYDASATACDGEDLPVYRNAPADDDESFHCTPPPSWSLSGLQRSALCVPADGPMPPVPVP